MNNSNTMQQMKAFGTTEDKHSDFCIPQDLIVVLSGLNAEARLHSAQALLAEESAFRICTEQDISRAYAESSRKLGLSDVERSYPPVVMDAVHETIYQQQRKKIPTIITQPLPQSFFYKERCLSRNYLSVLFIELFENGVCAVGSAEAVARAYFSYYSDESSMQRQFLSVNTARLSHSEIGKLLHQAVLNNVDGGIPQTENSDGWTYEDFLERVRKGDADNYPKLDYGFTGEIWFGENGLTAMQCFDKMVQEGMLHLYPKKLLLCDHEFSLYIDYEVATEPSNTAWCPYGQFRIAEDLGDRVLASSGDYSMPFHVEQTADAAYEFLMERFDSDAALRELFCYDRFRLKDD